MIEIEDLVVSYGVNDALKGVTLTARPGEITALVGANGAGKSSLLRAISGLAPIRRGRVVLGDRDVTRLAAAARARLGLGHTLEGRRLFRQLTVEQNLELAWSFGRKARRWAAARERAFERFPVLGEKRTTLAGLLSGGQQQMVIVSAATIGDPAFLLLDEPSLGLAPLIKTQIYDSFVALCRDQGAAVLLAEQVASFALGVAARGYVLRQGVVVSAGAASELLGGAESESLTAAYL